MAEPARYSAADLFAPARVWVLHGVTDRNREPEYAWIRVHANGYPGEWIVLDGDRLLAHSLSLDDCCAKLTPEQIQSALFHRVDVA